MTHSMRKLDDRGSPKGRSGAGSDEGLVVVGASMRHRDGRFHHGKVGGVGRVGGLVVSWLFSVGVFFALPGWRSYPRVWR